jgi:hypothetical protein
MFRGELPLIEVVVRLTAGMCCGELCNKVRGMARHDPVICMHNTNLQTSRQMLCSIAAAPVICHTTEAETHRTIIPRQQTTLQKLVSES